jgi:hypothetical protein
MQRILRSLVPLGLVLVSTSCALSVGDKRPGTPAVAGAESATEEAAQAERELKLARLDLELGSKKGEHALAEKREAILQKRAAREAAQQELHVFMSMGRPHKLAGADIELDDAMKDVWEAEQELEELKSMYAKEQFAERAKELVLGRGEKNLALAKRRLELAKAERGALEAGELAQQAAKLQEALRQATVELELAERELALAEVEAATEMEKARAEVEAKASALAKIKAGA